MFALPKSLNIHLCLMLVALALIGGVALGYYLAEEGGKSKK